MVTEFRHERPPMPLGKVIGSGASRIVHECVQDPSLVIKVPKTLEHAGTKSERDYIQNYDTQSVNYLEWTIWNAVKDTKYEKDFCPCICLTAEGYLVMKRAEVPLCESGDIKSLRRRLRHELCMADIGGTRNFGLYNERPVLIDYGIHLNKTALMHIKNHTKGKR